MRDDIIARRASGERDALARHFGRIDLPPEGLKEVEIPAPHGKGRTRRYDRAYPEGDTTGLVEAKNYRKSNLRLTKPIRQQLNNDIAILKSDDHVRIEVFLEGRVSTRALEAMKSMEKRFPGRYTIRYGETFDPRPRTRKRAKSGRKIKKDR